MEKWRFLYTKHSDISKAVTKTGALKEGNASRSAHITVSGKNHGDCLTKAMQEAGFKEKQLLGSRKVV